MMGTAVIVPAQQRLSASGYTEVEQANTKYGCWYFPVLVVLTIVTLGLLLVMCWGHKRLAILIGSSLVFIIFAVGLTGTKVLPLNKEMEKWSVQAPPENWQESRDQWHMYHKVRTFFALTAFVVLSAALLSSKIED